MCFHKAPTRRQAGVVANGMIWQDGGGAGVIDKLLSQTILSLP